jgi:hypothetical protein
MNFEGFFGGEKIKICDLSQFAADIHMSKSGERLRLRSSCRLRQTAIAFSAKSRDQQRPSI